MSRTYLKLEQKRKRWGSHLNRAGHPRHFLRVLWSCSSADLPGSLSFPSSNCVTKIPIEELQS